MPSKKENKILLIFIIIILCLPFLLGLAYRYRSVLKIDKRLIQLKDVLFSESDTSVKMNLIAKANDKDLRIVFYIPCKNDKAKQDILNNMPVIKHEMLMSLDDDKTKRSIEKRDFRRIKANFLEILNKYAPVDVNRVYVEFFAHN